MTENIFSSERRLSRQEIAEKLEGIAQGVEKGQLSLSYGQENIELEIGDNPEFEVEVEKEQDEYSLELEIEWKEGEEDGSLEIG